MLAWLSLAAERISRRNVPRRRAVEQVLVDDLEHFQAVHQLVAGQVDHAHAAATQFAQDLVLRIAASSGGSLAVRIGAAWGGLGDRYAGSRPDGKVSDLGKRTRCIGEQHVRRQQSRAWGAAEAMRFTQLMQEAVGRIAAAALRQVGQSARCNTTNRRGRHQVSQTECLQSVAEGCEATGAGIGGSFC